jgi:hypothetical protein
LGKEKDLFVHTTHATRNTAGSPSTISVPPFSESHATREANLPRTKKKKNPQKKREKKREKKRNKKRKKKRNKTTPECRHSPTPAPPGRV